MSHEVGRATFDQGRIIGPAVTVYGGRTRRERLDRLATKAWVGWRRRVGIAAWERNEDLPLFSGWPTTITAMWLNYRPSPPVRGTERWIRLPGTRWCLATYRRK